MNNALFTDDTSFYNPSFGKMFFFFFYSFDRALFYYFIYVSGVLREFHQRTLVSFNSSMTGATSVAGTRNGTPEFTHGF